MEGTSFGRYRLVELLGRGGMGEVWRAYDTDTDRVVALKVLTPHLAQNPGFAQRFRREAHAAARLNNPHIIPIHHYGEIDGRLYVDMRLIEGRDLQEVLADGPLPPVRAVRIIEQVAKALHGAHKIGLVHRDVKPSNVLIDDDDFAYLIDFGIARALDETRLTSTGNTIGTFLYIAPERLGENPDEDARADIYALACVLHECLTGQPPFPAANMAGLVAAHLNTPPPQPSTTHADVPPQFDDVIGKGMAKDPDERYSTTIELARDAVDAITAPIPRTTLETKRETQIDRAPTLSPETRHRPEPTRPSSLAPPQAPTVRSRGPIQQTAQPRTVPQPATARFADMSRSAFASVLAGIVFLSAAIGDFVVPYVLTEVGPGPVMLNSAWVAGILLLTMTGIALVGFGRGRTFPGRTILGCALIGMVSLKVMFVLLVFSGVI